MLKSCQATRTWSPNLRSANLSMSRVSWSDAFRCRAQKLSLAHCCSKQQRLYFLPLPQGQGSFLPILPFPGESIMSTHYPPKSGKTRAEVHAFVDFLLSIRLPP